MANAGLTIALIFMAMVTLLLGLNQIAINDITDGQGVTVNGCGK